MLSDKTSDWQAQQMNTELGAIVDARNNKALAPGEMKKATGWILQLAFENIIQHGSSENLERKLSASSFNHQGIFIPVKYQVTQDNNDILVTVSNPQVKPFPKALEGEFLAGDKLSIPIDERLGFTGNGVATGYIVNQLNNLPAGSSVRWISDGNQINFVLKIHLPVN